MHTGIRRACQALAKMQGAAGVGVCSRGTSFADAGWVHAAIQRPAARSCWSDVISGQLANPLPCTLCHLLSFSTAGATARPYQLTGAGRCRRAGPAHPQLTPLPLPYGVHAPSLCSHPDPEMEGPCRRPVGMGARLIPV